jgi:hypothetical protein
MIRRAVEAGKVVVVVVGGVELAMMLVFNWWWGRLRSEVGQRVSIEMWKE